MSTNSPQANLSEATQKKRGNPPPGTGIAAILAPPTNPATVRARVVLALLTDMDRSRIDPSSEESPIVELALEVHEPKESPCAQYNGRCLAVASLDLSGQNEGDAEFINGFLDAIGAPRGSFWSGQRVVVHDGSIIEIGGVSLDEVELLVNVEAHEVDNASYPGEQELKIVGFADASGCPLDGSGDFEDGQSDWESWEDLIAVQQDWLSRVFDATAAWGRDGFAKRREVRRRNEIASNREWSKWREEHDDGDCLADRCRFHFGEAEERARIETVKPATVERMESLWEMHALDSCLPGVFCPFCFINDQEAERAEEEAIARAKEALADAATSSSEPNDSGATAPDDARPASDQAANKAKPPKDAPSRDRRDAYPADWPLAPEATQLWYVQQLLWKKGLAYGGSDKWQCPAHDDHNPSLWVNQGARSVRITCVSQHCDKKAILAALGTTWPHVFAHDPGDPTVLGRAPSDPPNGQFRSKGRGKGSVAQQVEQRCRENKTTCTATHYDYWSPDGQTLLRKVTRYDFADGSPKLISQDIRDGTPALYPQKQLNEAIAAGWTIYVMEGEKAAQDFNEYVEAKGIKALAVTAPGGAGQWKPEHGVLLDGAKRVIIVVDSDKAGEKHAELVARSLDGPWMMVKSRTTREKDDWYDHHADGGKIKDLVFIAEGSGTGNRVRGYMARDEFESFDPGTSADEAKQKVADEEPPEKENEGTKPKSPSVAKLLVEIGFARYRFGQSLDHKTFAVPTSGPNLARELGAKDKLLSAELSRELYERTGLVPSTAALGSAKTVLLGRASAAEPEPLALRVAEPEPGRIVIDLGDEEGRAVVVTAAGWEVVDRSPVLFRRTPLIGPFPTPERGGDLSALAGQLNVDADTFDLLVGWCVAAFLPDIPHAVLLFNGEQGTAKTSATKMIVRLIDPSPVPTRALPRDENTWHTAASASWAVALENVSYLPPWLSDALCRAATGDGTVVRELYSDDGIHTKSYRRVIIINGIEPGGVRGDLADRMVIANLERIPDARRKSEAEVSSAFEAIWPLVFGALLDLLVGVLEVRRTGRDALDSMPRMADFARVLRAVDLVRGSETLKTYLARAKSAQADLAENDAVTQALRDLLSTARYAGRIRCTAGALLDALGPLVEGDRAFPKTPQGLSQQLTRLAPGLRDLGWIIETGKKSNGAKLVEIELPGATA